MDLTQALNVCLQLGTRVEPEGLSDLGIELAAHLDFLGLADQRELALPSSGIDRTREHKAEEPGQRPLTVHARLMA